MNPWIRRCAHLAAGCLALGSLGGCSSAPPQWRPIPGASVRPFEQAQGMCARILESGDAEPKIRAQYRSCMAEHGWTQSPVSRQAHERRRGRDEAQRREAEQLKAEIRKRRTKNDLTLFAGVAPKCQRGDPGTEICSWEWTWRSRTVATPIRLTCILPKDGAPRGDQSCHIDPGELPNEDGATR